MNDSIVITETLARFIVETPQEHVPDAMRHQAKRALLNILATGVHGAIDPTYETLLRSLPLAEQGRATIIGRKERSDVLTAAFLNATGATIDDFCDTHLPTVIHPTAPIMPALYALSQLQQVRGVDILDAFVIGVEVACRIGNSISPSHYRTRGWHITASCGVFGAAAAAGRILGLNVNQMVWALGGAAAQSSGLVEMLGWPTKTLGVGNAARNGLWSALLAQRGFEGPPQPLEGRFGFFNAIGETPKLPALLAGLGDTWELASNSYKPYPGGIVLHPAIDCVLDLRAKGGFKTEDVTRVIVYGHQLLIERADRPNVTSGSEARISVQHSIAAAQIFGAAGLEQYTDACVHDPRVLAFRRKVEVVQDGNMSVNAAMVEIWTKDGKRHKISTDAARGSIGRPLTDRDLEQKFASLAAPYLNGGGHQLVDAVWALDEADDASMLLAMAVPP